MKDNRNYLSKKYAALKRYCMWYYLSKKLDLILVSEFPKSGGTWYCQMLASYLQLPYPRNRTPKLEKSILHGHAYYNTRFNKIVCITRDGRDALVSYYHHMYFGNSIMQPAELQNYRARAPFKNFEDIRGNMPAYIQYMFSNFTMGAKPLTWSGFIHSYLNQKNVVHVKYENLLQNIEKEMSESIMALMGNSFTIDTERLKQSIKEYSFETLSNREKGEEIKSDFLRKAVAGDWKNHFSKDACKMFDHYAGKELILLGYENDRNWIDNAEV